MSGSACVFIKLKKPPATPLTAKDVGLRRSRSRSCFCKTPGQVPSSGPEVERSRWAVWADRAGHHQCAQRIEQFGQIGLVGGEFTQAYKDADQVNRDLHGSRAVEVGGGHQRTMLNKDMGQIFAMLASEFEIPILCFFQISPLPCWRPMPSESAT